MLLNCQTDYPKTSRFRNLEKIFLIALVTSLYKDDQNSCLGEFYKITFRKFAETCIKS